MLREKLDHSESSRMLHAVAMVLDDSNYNDCYNYVQDARNQNDPNKVAEAVLDFIAQRRSVELEAQVKELKELVHQFANAEWEYDNLRPSDWLRGWILKEVVQKAKKHENT